ncbi:DE-cadherin [Bacillus rossius redtenbacheri]|uniref:DE-cadherin n=1 Tax=Bacillus rossius redtenbacheri TaxID=93214 RepID=UPI002FDEEE12
MAFRDLLLLALFVSTHSSSRLDTQDGSQLGQQRLRRTHRSNSPAYEPKLRHTHHLADVRAPVAEALRMADQPATLTKVSVAGGEIGTRLVIQDNHKPVFSNCSSYEPYVKEEQDVGTFVFQVKAIDKDPPESGGTVTYTFVEKSDEKTPKFKIDPNTGVITTQTVFDRDEPYRDKAEYLVIRATDNGRPQLDDVCNMKVVIEDINDNFPVFDKVSYLESMPQDTPTNREVMRISATDIDDGENSRVTYSLEDNPGYFRIDSSTGVIFLDKPIDKDPGYMFRMTGRAEDHGEPKRTSVIGLEILVVESHKKAPAFIDVDSNWQITLPENYSNYTAPLPNGSFKAVSNIDNGELTFELVTGRTEQTNSKTTFILESKDDTAFLKLGKPLDYETINEYVLTLRVQNKQGLAAETTINVFVTDVNDNIPSFNFKEVPEGIVLENEPPGTPVMQIRAVDMDGTSANNQVRYKLDETSKNRDLFHIDLDTGNITTLQTFDRELINRYVIKVIAYDNSPSALKNNGEPNKAEINFWINIGDKNDNPPKFTMPVYVANQINEDANVNQLVIQVVAEDNDTASPVTYDILEGNVGDAFFIENNTGKIRVKNPLDYETITSYTLLVRAFDGKYNDTAKVEIKITNVNDNPPVFYKFNSNITIPEEKLVEGCIANISAYDPDIPDRNAPQNIQFYVVKKEQRELLTIDESGCLKLIKPLDRDPPHGSPVWQVLIAANDENGGRSSLQSTTEVIIILEDINDNAPTLDMVQPVVWYERQPPGKIATLQAKDNDSERNGAPFYFKLDSSAGPDITSNFAITNSKDLQALVTFDREERKEYILPIAITDSGSPPLTGTSTLKIVIGDVNDNPMGPGESNIFVYNYKGESPDTEIGRVYVVDPDDWDLPDKEFTWRSGNHPNFDLNSSTGMITMLRGTQDGSYLLEFTVTESAQLVPHHSVDAIVNVTVKVIPEEAVDKSGSIRFAGITAEEFIAPGPNGGPSKQSILRQRLASFLNVSQENVDVFTVLHSPHNSNATILDVRYSAHASPYRMPEKLNTLAASHQEELEQELGVKILMFSIDECLLEKVSCETSCTNFLNKSNVPYAVYTNTTSFVGVRAVVDPLCTCVVQEKSFCLNGGTPVGPTQCECIEGFEGPRCEMISIGFRGNGWALYPPVAACEEARLTVEVTPYKDDGLILYMGPVRHNPALPVQDFMSLELKSGYARLLMDYGSGTTFVEHTDSKLSDGKLHLIEVIWSKTSIELKVDNCQKSSCLALTTPEGPNEYLNVNGPLQVGGATVDLPSLASVFRWKHVPVSDGFSGCVRNLTFNDKTYNLGFPSDSLNVDPGCTREMAKAVSFGIDTNFLVAILVCIAILLILLLAVVVHRRKTDDLYKDTDDIRENIINYEDEGGGEGDMTGYDLNVLRLMYDSDGRPIDKQPLKENYQQRSGPEEVPDICGFLDNKKKVCDNDPETNPFDDVRHYAYEGDGNTTGSLSSLASGTEEGDLNFDYVSNFGPRFHKLADMYGEDPSDEEDENYNNNAASESWC